MKPQDLLTAPFVRGTGDGQTTHCTVEAIGLVIYGHLDHRDDLPCLDAVAQAAVIAVQDRISDQARASERFRRVALRLLACHRHNSARHARRLALWCARSVEHLAGPEAKRRNDVTERYLAGEVSAEERLGAHAAAYPAYAFYTAYAAHAAADAAAVHAAAAIADDPIGWLGRFFDAWQKIAADEGCLLPDDQDEEYERVRRDVLAMLDGEQVTT